VTSIERFSTGVAGLDALLGGGLLPGTLTVAVGASGIGKTQLGIQFAAAGQGQEGRRGILFDMNARVDSQSHDDYAQRMFDWRLQEAESDGPPDALTVLQPDYNPGEFLHVFRHDGRRMNQRDVSFDTWHDWQAELASKLHATIAFFYGNFTRGCRRAVVDGVEPTERQSQSIQFELFEYVYHQILRKEHDWVARDLLRQHFRSHSDWVEAHAYDHRQIACLLLYTSHETMLDRLIERPLDDGDLLAGANTVIYMGKVRNGQRLDRGLYIAKHRGSACSDHIATYRIGDDGLRIDSAAASS
jgi:KaiC/GvpD/RAD55 family RecA-like ATPase